jgi:hypothetical protein
LLGFTTSKIISEIPISPIKTGEWMKVDCPPSGYLGLSAHSIYSVAHAAAAAAAAASSR